MISCTFENRKIPKNKLFYKSILINIFTKIGRENVILQSVLNMENRDMNNLKGYIWFPELQLSIQSNNANKTFHEIVRITELNKLKLEIQIKLKNKKTFEYKI